MRSPAGLGGRVVVGNYGLLQCKQRVTSEQLSNAKLIGGMLIWLLIIKLARVMDRLIRERTIREQELQLAA